MSSLVRRIQKNIARKMGYVRQQQRIEPGDPPRVVRLRKGEGDILNGLGESTGSKRWPQVSVASNPKDKARLARESRDVLHGRMAPPEMVVKKPRRPKKAAA